MMFMQRVSVVLHGTLESELRDVVRDGCAHEVDCFPTLWA
jgi:hypothetical protein